MDTIVMFIVLLGVAGPFLVCLSLWRLNKLYTRSRDVSDDKDKEITLSELSSIRRQKVIWWIVMSVSSLYMIPILKNYVSGILEVLSGILEVISS